RSEEKAPCVRTTVPCLLCALESTRRCSRLRQGRRSRRGFRRGSSRGRRRPVQSEIRAFSFSSVIDRDSDPPSYEWPGRGSGGSWALSTRTSSIRRDRRSSRSHPKHERVAPISESSIPLFGILQRFAYVLVRMQGNNL